MACQVFCLKINGRCGSSLLEGVVTSIHYNDDPDNEGQAPVMQMQATINRIASTCYLQCC